MEINQLIDKSLYDLNSEFFEGNIDLAIQTVRQKFTKKIMRDCHDFDFSDCNVHSVKVGIDGSLDQHVKICRFQFEKIVSDTWETSSLKKFIDKGFCIFTYTYTEDNSASAVFSGILKFYFSDYEKSIIKRVWLVTNNTVANGNILKSTSPVKTNWIGKSRKLIVHVRPDANNSRDTFALPVADKLSGKIEYTKHAFWLNKEFIEEKLKR